MPDDIQMAVLRKVDVTYDPARPYWWPDVNHQYATGIDMHGRVTGWDKSFRNAVILDDETAVCVGIKADEDITVTIGRQVELFLAATYGTANEVAAAVVELKKISDEDVKENVKIIIDHFRGAHK